MFPLMKVFRLMDDTNLIRYFFEAMDEVEEVIAENFSFVNNRYGVPILKSSKLIRI